MTEQKTGRERTNLETIQNPFYVDEKGGITARPVVKPVGVIATERGTEPLYPYFPPKKISDDLLEDFAERLAEQIQGGYIPFSKLKN